MAQRRADPETEVELAISLENVCFLVAKAREFDEAADFIEPMTGESAEDEVNLHPEETLPDPALQEFAATVDALSEDERIDLVALFWLGRDDGGAGDWAETRAAAAEADNDRTAAYLCRDPLLADNIEAGLTALGLSCEGFAVV